MVCTWSRIEPDRPVREVGTRWVPAAVVDRVAKALETYDSVMSGATWRRTAASASSSPRPWSGGGRRPSAGAAETTTEHGLTDRMGS